MKISVEIGEATYERMVAAARRNKLACKADELAEVMIRLGCRTLEGRNADEDTEP